MSEAHGGYYIPHGSHWPLVGSVGLTTTVVGFASFLNGAGFGLTMMLAGLAITVFMMFGWFGTVIRESESHMYNSQVDKSFRWGMSWFIFSEVMFFAAFFGALFYARAYSIPWIAGGDRAPMSYCGAVSRQPGRPMVRPIWAVNSAYSIRGRYRHSILCCCSPVA